MLRALLLLMAAFAALAADARAAGGDPLSVCLARQRIGVAVRTVTTGLDGSRRTGEGDLAFGGAVQEALSRLGAGVVPIEASLGANAGAAALARPLNEAASRRATWLLALAVEAREYPLAAEFAMGAPWRTIAIGMDANLVDARRRVILASHTVPARPFARRSTAEAMSELLADDSTFYQVLTQLLQQACAQPGEEAVARSVTPPPSELAPQPIRQPQPKAAEAINMSGEAETGAAVRGVPKRHRAILIGIADYKHLDAAGTDPADLQFADNDARAFASFLSDQTQSGAQWDIIGPLLNEQATQRAIEKAIDDAIDHALNDDVVLFFFSGHGRAVSRKQDVYLLPYDFDPNDNSSGVLFNNLQERVSVSAALQIIMVVDACRSGQIRMGEKSASKNFAIRTYLETDIGKMRTLFASSSASESSYESEKLRHGIFTYYLLEAMRRLRPDTGVITLRDLERYIQPKVDEFALSTRGLHQTPRLLFDNGGYFGGWPLAFTAK